MGDRRDRRGKGAGLERAKERERERERAQESVETTGGLWTEGLPVDCHVRYVCLVVFWCEGGSSALPSSLGGRSRLEEGGRPVNRASA